MRTIRFLIIVIFMFFLAFECKASTIECSYNFGNNKVVEKNTGKETTITRKYIDNNLFYYYKINNINNFNELDDYIVISNTKGHKITYSLKCYIK